MAREFATCVEYGLNLSKRIYYGKEMTPAATAAMTRSMSAKSSDVAESYFPTAVMAYAVVSEPELVENPDVPSYQPYVHGRCEPPALIPLHMLGVVTMEIDCCFDHANVCFSGAWRVHCIKGNSKCDVRIAVPIGEQGSLLGVEVDVPRRSYHSQLIEAEDANYKEKVSKGGNGRLMRGSVYTFKIPQVEGGATVSIKVIWSQKLLYHEGQFSLNVPFSFPAFVNPVGKKISKREKILLNVSSGVGKEILCKSTSHALKEIRREVGKMGFLYDAEVLTWSSADFSFSYNVCSKDLFGGVLLQSPLLRDIDDRQMFCFYLFPGNNQSMKAFRKEVIFIIDISGSMKGGPFESAKNGLLSSLQKLNPEDSFSIIAFNMETYLFSSVMELATEKAIIEATRWLNDTLTAGGGTNILVPLKQAIRLLAETTNSIPVIFLITDGAVEDERDICNFVKGYLTSRGSISLRISTLGIGTYCNHHFLRMLAQIGRGHFDTAYDADSVDFRLQKLFTTASSIILADITVDALEHLDSLELLPFCIPDLSRGSPLIVSGRYSGNFPDPVKLSGTLADKRKFTIDLKAQKTKDLPFDRVVGRRQIDLLTANAWLSGSKELEQKVAKMSIQTGFPSEYTLMVLHQTLTDEKAPETILIQDVFNKMNPLKKMDFPKTIVLRNLCVGFGNLTATAENIPPGTEETKSSEATGMLVKAASNCCGRVVDRCCCMCFIQTCSYMNNQCSIVLSQLCAALACVECINCCIELCECG
ncbi:PREDICTED: inter-alpha-trypsin inhibitor heavy chain H3-like isoform X2 [Populus euphratica]|uniref:Inter-alpha-trypsin inhibitor heavy chain H3-like isoform X2 n=1 Tax=Populus euphratica TaxID=75702 RepID=A0AAJ6XZE6_POPEU|nr:PREDICTED: inter-alpha-trypsin inhibitor heavy chain H3-like isoform X2 [Populus euphratica]